MEPLPVVVLHELPDDVPQVTFAEEDEVVQALVLERLHEPLRVRVAIWALRRGLTDFTPPACKMLSNAFVKSGSRSWISKMVGIAVLCVVGVTRMALAFVFGQDRARLPLMLLRFRYRFARRIDSYSRSGVSIQVEGE
jgi:hypothetical protein